jgi:hypothetical protein
MNYFSYCEYTNTCMNKREFNNSRAVHCVNVKLCVLDHREVSNTHRYLQFSSKA